MTGTRPPAAPGVLRLLAAAQPRPATEGCAVCDGPFDPRRADAADAVLIDGPDGTLRRALRTHHGCAPGRVWAPTQLGAARLSRGRPTACGPVAPDDRPRAADVLETAMSGGPGRVLPAIMYHPGAPYPHGLLGHLADRLTEGLPPLDLTGAVPAEDLPGWAVHVVAGRVTAVTHADGTGLWWARPGGVPTSREWRRAADATGRVYVGVMPGGEEPTDPGDVAALGRAIRAGLVLGGIAVLAGTVH